MEYPRWAKWLHSILDASRFKLPSTFWTNSLSNQIRLTRGNSWKRFSKVTFHQLDSILVKAGKISSRWFTSKFLFSTLFTLFLLMFWEKNISFPLLGFHWALFIRSPFLDFSQKILVNFLKKKIWKTAEFQQIEFLI